MCGNGHMFYLLLRSAAQRSAFIAAMREAGIGTPFHYVPLHSSPGGQRFGRATGPVRILNGLESGHRQGVRHQDRSRLPAHGSARRPYRGIAARA